MTKRQIARTIKGTAARLHDRDPKDLIGYELIGIAAQVEMSIVADEKAEADRVKVVAQSAEPIKPARFRSRGLQSLHDRYIGDDPERVAAFEQAVAEAKAEMADDDPAKRTEHGYPEMGPCPKAVMLLSPVQPYADYEARAKIQDAEIDRLKVKVAEVEKSLFDETLELQRANEASIKTRDVARAEVERLKLIVDCDRKKYFEESVRLRKQCEAASKSAGQNHTELVIANAKLKAVEAELERFVAVAHGNRAVQAV